MNDLIAQPEAAMASGDRLTGDTRLHGRLLLFVRVVCIAAGILSLGVYTLSIPATFNYYLFIFCSIPACTHPGPGVPQFIQQLQALGLSVPAYAIYFIVLNIIFVCTYFSVAIILLLRRSDDWIALFASFFLMTFAINFSGNTMEIPAPPWNLLFLFVSFLGATSLVVFFYLFPSGRFVPGWTRWLSIGAALYWGLKYFLPPFAFNPYNNLIFVVIGFLVFVGGMIIAQVYRYLHISNSVQRNRPSGLFSVCR